eukprot:PhF_6_TR36071/c0_g1_i7/m.52384
MDVLTVIVEFVGIDVAMSLRCVSTSYRHVVQEHPTHRYIPITLCEHSLSPNTMYDDEVDGDCEGDDEASRDVPTYSDSSLVATFHSLYANVRKSVSTAYNHGGVGCVVMKLSRDASYLIEWSLVTLPSRQHPLLRDVLFDTPYDKPCATPEDLEPNLGEMFAGWNGTDPKGFSNLKMCFPDAFQHPALLASFPGDTDFGICALMCQSDGEPVYGHGIRQWFVVKCKGFTD